MADVTVSIYNKGASWKKFSPTDYWDDNYSKLGSEDQEIIRLVSGFFKRTFTDRPRARRGIDVGSGPNLYPALLMLPWAEQILLTDFSPNNVQWLRREIASDAAPWDWQPFWAELQETDGYDRIGEPRKQLREACAAQPGYAGVEQQDVFRLSQERWDLGTMFFVAESITEDPAEFQDAIAGFLGALTPQAPFAAAFMTGSDGYRVADTSFPAVPVTPDDVQLRFLELGATELSVDVLQTSHRVRDGYEAMTVATGFAGDR